MENSEKAVCKKCGKNAVAWVPYVDGYLCQECWDAIPESANAVGDYV